MSKPTRITIHHSLTKDSKTVSWNAIRKYHTTEPRLMFYDIGYQFGLELVAEHYEILIGRMMNQQGAHVRGHNRNNLGICFVGNYDLAPPPEKMWNLGVKFVSSLCEVLDISVMAVRGHHEYDSNKTCPGTQFDMNKFRNNLRGRD